jgi:L-malate glycosyltransferase
MRQNSKQAKRICIVTPEFPPEDWGGLARTVQRVAEHAASMGLEVHVAHLMVEPDHSILLDENRNTEILAGITVHRLTVGRDSMAGRPRQLWDCPHNLTLQMMYQSLEMLHTDEGFDIFHSFFLYPIGYITGLLARRMRTPHLTTLVGNDIKRYIFSPEKAGVCRSGLENADRVVGLSLDLLEMADALVPIMSKSRVIYNSVKIPALAWNSLPHAEKEPYRIGCAGIFKYAKGLPYLIKAIASLNQRRGDVILELVGTLRESERAVFYETLQKTEVGNHVLFKDALSHSDIPQWMMNLDVFALPSVTEGCPNILMEAMATGLPCVATRTGANEALVEDRVSGLLAPWGNSEALAAALETVLAQPELASSMGQAARNRMENFSTNREREEWEQLYREVLEF